MNAMRLAEIKTYMYCLVSQVIGESGPMKEMG